MLLKLVHLDEKIVVAVVEIWLETLLAQCRLCPRKLLVLLVVVRGEREVVLAGVEDLVQRHRLPIAVRHRVVLGGRHVPQTTFLCN